MAGLARKIGTDFVAAVMLKNVLRVGGVRQPPGAPTVQQCQDRAEFGLRQGSGDIRNGGGRSEYLGCAEKAYFDQGLEPLVDQSAGAPVLRWMASKRCTP